MSAQIFETQDAHCDFCDQKKIVYVVQKSAGQCFELRICNDCSHQAIQTIPKYRPWRTQAELTKIIAKLQKDLTEAMALENQTKLNEETRKLLLLIIHDSGKGIPGEPKSKGLLSPVKAQEFFRIALVPPKVKLADAANWLTHHHIIENFDWGCIPSITTSLSLRFKTKLEPVGKDILKLWKQLGESETGDKCFHIAAATLYCRFTASIARTLPHKDIKNLVSLLEDLLVRTEEWPLSDSDEHRRRVVAGFVQLSSFLNSNWSRCADHPNSDRRINEIARRHRESFDLHSEARDL